MKQYQTQTHTPIKNIPRTSEPIIIAALTVGYWLGNPEQTDQEEEEFKQTMTANLTWFRKG